MPGRHCSIHFYNYKDCTALSWNILILKGEWDLKNIVNAIAFSTPMVVVGEPMSSWGSHWHPYKLMIFNVCEIWNKVIISLLNTIPFNTSPQHRWWSTNVILDVLIDDLPLVSRVPVSPNPISRLELSQLWTIQSPVGGNSPSNVYTSLKYKYTYKMKSRQLKTQTQESQTQREYNAISCHQVHSISKLLLSDIARVLSEQWTHSMIIICDRKL